MPLYLGLISGTSADGIDAALVDIDGQACQLIGHYFSPFTPQLQQRIHQLCTPGDDEIERAGALDRELGEKFAEAAKALLSQENLGPKSIAAIGSHGQTIRHRPPGQSATPFSWQIGDPNIIAERTGITTVADLRRRDMAAGGQGAPLVPAFHKAVFASPTTARAVINIGGIGNISWLAPGREPLGFDTGPGNTLLDSWVQKHLDQCYDENGAWGQQGQLQPTLLEVLLEHPYLARPTPKSSGREEFNLPWLETVLAEMPVLDPQDVQATLVEFSAQTIAQHLLACPGADQGGEMYICGGGTHNPHLLQRLQAQAPGFSLHTTSALGIDPDWVEAAAFAWLAGQTMSRLAGNVPAVTGAQREVILGGVYPA
ncbi:anhydro-N-acetylmuramic acid kinase [Gilvimarinus xylanilyticus]|uniref:Anhydro-N-acetylmuramic acid kinase n=1 Tax=Gilvimarinus xylanilyticus TaxID=2944139 RepID=A0A9X2I2R3_9GAMM|nr:anhydro-N-acetylmuramic acid kinase [Gilvimarinus xylanilyticus]MCP8899753.1 anhydro-N-acetylmuramic acid kinase [Gilvimarinus xylanilyticus]